MAAPHEVAKLAFDLGTGGPIVGSPSGALLTSPGAGQRIFMGPDGDRPPSAGSGALGPQRAVGARLAEDGSAVAVGATADAYGHIVRAGDGAGAEVDIETVLGEKVAGRAGRLGLAPRGDVGVFELGQIGRASW